MVGLTAYLEQVRTGVWDIPAGYLPADYFEGITMAGVLRYCCRRSRSTRERRLRAGQPARSGDHRGYDLDPAAYGQEPHPATDHPRPGRDAWEFALLRGALQRGCPCWASVAAPRCSTSRSAARCTSTCPTSLAIAGIGRATGLHQVAGPPASGTRLAELIGESADVPCYHHQAIDQVGEGLVVSAVDVDG